MLKLTAGAQIVRQPHPISGCGATCWRSDGSQKRLTAWREHARCLPARLPAGAGLDHRGAGLRRGHRRRRPAVDKHTGKPVFQCRSPTWIPTGRPPAGDGGQDPGRPDATPPTGAPFEPVEFDGLQVTPYVDTGRCQGRGRCRARMAFSLRATGIKAARVPRRKAGRGLMPAKRAPRCRFRSMPGPRPNSGAIRQRSPLLTIRLPGGRPVTGHPHPAGAGRGRACRVRPPARRLRRRLRGRGRTPVPGPGTSRGRWLPDGGAVGS
jgi:hypothetical protein